jgi:hypothetical protein
MRRNSPEVPKPAIARLRCAIYTRKSTEEGLDQEFNSLDAQREAAEAFIQSQRREGWIALPEFYDDGGFTGANMDRPALARLLQAVEASELDCVVPSADTTFVREFLRRFAALNIQDLDRCMRLCTELSLSQDKTDVDLHQVVWLGRALRAGGSGVLDVLEPIVRSVAVPDLRTPALLRGLYDFLGTSNTQDQEFLSTVEALFASRPGVALPEPLWRFLGIDPKGLAARYIIPVEGRRIRLEPGSLTHMLRQGVPAERLIEVHKRVVEYYRSLTHNTFLPESDDGDFWNAIFWHAVQAGDLETARSLAQTPNCLLLARNMEAPINWFRT